MKRCQCWVQGRRGPSQKRRSMLQALVNAWYILEQVAASVLEQAGMRLSWPVVLQACLAAYRFTLWFLRRPIGRTANALPQPDNAAAAQPQAAAQLQM